MSQTLWNALRASLLVYALYLYGLANVGLLSADEPRYGAISQEMAKSGDWVTPRLWGQPWFEKPALLYWIGGLGFRLGLGTELAPRLPVALLSIGFLGFYFSAMRRSFDSRTALFATAILGTSAGWVAFSRVAVTDLPMTVFFSAAMMMLLPAWSGNEEDRSNRTFLTAGALLGLAVLSKALVPLAFCAPLVRFARRDAKRLTLLAAACLVVAVPWYALCAARNGPTFLIELIWKQHFLRFFTDNLAHTQRFWFYIPVFLAGLFPWTPALALVFNRDFYRDPRVRFFAAWAGWIFVFLSASKNKLPGYLLPMMPAVAAIIGIRLASVTAGYRWVLASCCLLLAFVPLIASALPSALAYGLSRAALPPIPWMWMLPAALLSVLCWWLARAGERTGALAVVVVGMSVSVVFATLSAYPALDRDVSARSLWLRIRPSAADVCLGPVNRNWEYGLDYYAGRAIPPCP